MTIFSFLPQKMLFYWNCFKINRKITLSLYDITLSTLSKCSFPKVIWYHPVAWEAQRDFRQVTQFLPHAFSSPLIIFRGTTLGLPGNFSSSPQSLRLRETSLCACLSLPLLFLEKACSSLE